MLTPERVIDIARQLAGQWMWRMETRQPEPHRLDILLSSGAELVPFVTALRVQRLGILAAITGLDLGAESGVIEVLYHFCHGAAVITLRLSLPRQAASVPTLTEIIPSAESSERELAEMFGVRVVGLRAEEHLYLPEDWPEATFPLRKDAILPVQGG